MFRITVIFNFSPFCHVEPRFFGSYLSSIVVGATVTLSMASLLLREKYERHILSAQSFHSLVSV